ncbi:hypothetical protein N7519_004889 [Penicillium mononematosum]|uniref:uncharacterized protein n=1 Tax=Penicillium mononematosum TaxID=268346 RepID=UPI0025481AC9|nr:uncharacterized protein N7519_004889 [Penicillium mononematosum]KAJ6183588.1 hypothetical protein N7519_004889 [Penicillium mononematosum]
MTDNASLENRPCGSPWMEQPKIRRRKPPSRPPGHSNHVSQPWWDWDSIHWNQLDSGPTPKRQYHIVN